MNDVIPADELTALSARLRQLHARVLEIERSFHTPVSPLELLDRLTKDPQWAWLRPLSTLIAEIDHVLAQSQPATEYDWAAVAGHARELLGDSAVESEFAQRYRGLLQMSPDLVSTHGEVKALLKRAPAEPADEAERLHHRHQWAMKCKHRALP